MVGIWGEESSSNTPWCVGRGRRGEILNTVMSQSQRNQTLGIKGDDVTFTLSPPRLRECVRAHAQTPVKILGEQQPDLCRDQR